MQDEHPYPPQLDFYLNRYERDEAGLVANIEDARTIIRNLQQIIRFLEVAPFETLALTTQSEISLYLVGTHLLTQPVTPADEHYQAKFALLEALFNEEMDQTIQSDKAALDTDEILQSIDHLLRGQGE